MLRWAGGVLAFSLCSFASAVGAQPLPVFVRLSAEATPNVAPADVVRQRRVEIPAASVLADDAQSRTLILDLFPDVSFRAVRQQLAPTAHGVSWVGTLDGYPQSTAIFVLVGDEVVGHIYAPFGFFRIGRQADGSYLAQQVDLGPPQPNDAIEPPPEATAARAATNTAGVSMLDDGSGIDVLVAYTQDAARAYITESNARATIDLLVAETNQALANSGIATRVRLVHAVRVDYVETGDSSLDLSRLRLPTDGFLDDVAALRDLYQADLVALITETAADVCGRGYLPVRAGSPSSAYSITKRSCTANGRTFAHELGHNLGAHHDWYETASPGVATYSKGYVSLAGRFLDIMAYSNLCRDSRVSCAQALSYSNPASTRDNHPMGVPAGTNTTCTAANLDNPPCDADASRTFREMASTVAQYRNSSLSILARQILPGGSLRSPNLRFLLLYQTDGNLVLYDDVTKTPLWATNTGGTTPGVATMQPDGNFVLYNSANLPLWSSGTAGNPDAFFSLQNDGNFVIYRADGQPLWATGTAQ